MSLRCCCASSVISNEAQDTGAWLDWMPTTGMVGWIWMELLVISLYLPFRGIGLMQMSSLGTYNQMCCKFVIGTRPIAMGWWWGCPTMKRWHPSVTPAPPEPLHPGKSGWEWGSKPGLGACQWRAPDPGKSRVGCRSWDWALAGPGKSGVGGRSWDLVDAGGR